MEGARILYRCTTLLYRNSRRVTRRSRRLTRSLAAYILFSEYEVAILAAVILAWRSRATCGARSQTTAKRVGDRSPFLDWSGRTGFAAKRSPFSRFSNNTNFLSTMPATFNLTYLPPHRFYCLLIQISYLSNRYFSIYLIISVHTPVSHLLKYLEVIVDMFYFYLWMRLREGSTRD
jgi:hypothetical protein